MGHQGIVKTKALIRTRLWFPGIDRHVERAVRVCPECQACAKRRFYEPLRPSEMPIGPWRELAGDFYGPMRNGKYLYANMDKYSRYACVEQISSVAGTTTIPVLDKLFAMFGNPDRYQTDNGPPFNSHEFAKFMERRGTISFTIFLQQSIWSTCFGLHKQGRRIMHCRTRDRGSRPRYDRTSN